MGVVPQGSKGRITIFGKRQKGQWSPAEEGHCFSMQSSVLGLMDWFRQAPQAVSKGIHKFELLKWPNMW